MAKTKKTGGRSLGKFLKDKKRIRKILGPSILKIQKRPMGGKVYKVDNSGQDLVQKMYGGKIKKWEIKY